MVAEAGFRSHFHLGGLAATRELAERCRVDADKRVLEVGCGPGKTACYLASHFGCRVIGVDFLKRMADRASERAVREKVSHRVAFAAADAQQLPFDDDEFDVVIGEFITGLVDDKAAALSECLRVTRAGGYVGINEATWIKPAPPELADRLARTFGVAEVLASGDWMRLLEHAGLKDIEQQCYRAGRKDDAWERLKDLLPIGHRVVHLLLTDATFRTMIRESFALPGDFLEYFGYGIYVGRK
jgi:ubiquinone/menaquinone biosynthesis C-methylase UbiE